MVNFENLKLVYDLLAKAQRQDLVKDIQDLREALLDSRDENRELREKNNELGEQLKLKSQIIYERGICWVVDDEMTSDKAKTAVCSRCWQIDKIVNRIPLSKYSDGWAILCSRDRHGRIMLRD